MNTDDLMSTATTLQRRKDWPGWYNRLQYHCVVKEIWHLVDPEGADAPARPRATGPPISVETLLLERDNKLYAAHKVSEEAYKANPATDKGLSPLPPIPSVFDDVEKDFRARLQYYNAQSSFQSLYNANYAPIFTWIQKTVDPNLLETIQTALIQKKNNSLQDLVRELKSMMAPSATSAQTTVQ